MQKLDEAHSLLWSFQPTLVTVRLFQSKLCPNLHLSWNSLPLICSCAPFQPSSREPADETSLKEGQWLSHLSMTQGLCLTAEPTPLPQTVTPHQQDPRNSTSPQYCSWATHVPNSTVPNSNLCFLAPRARSAPKRCYSKQKLGAEKCFGKLCFLAYFKNFP